MNTFFFCGGLAVRWMPLGTKSVTYNAENADFNSFDFSDLLQNVVFDKIGRYQFRMTEIVGNLEDIDYDKSVHTFAVRVTDVDMDGSLEIAEVDGSRNVTVTKENGTFRVAVIFNNTFVPSAHPNPDDTSVTVTVNKTVKNTSDMSIGPNGFEFVLENVVTGEKTASRSDKDGKAYFTLAFTAEDIGKDYAFTLREVNDGSTGVTYDSKVYRIDIAVSLDEYDRLVADIAMNGAETKEAVAEFENIYHAVRPPASSAGDSANTFGWVLMMIVSAAAFVSLIILDRRCAAKIE